MDWFKRYWRRMPRSIRRPLVFVLGLIFVIAAGLLGWLPGPGGIPLFLIGIAIWATEFEWAQKVRDIVIEWVRIAGKWLRRHKVLGAILIVVGISLAITISLFTYHHFKH